MSEPSAGSEMERRRRTALRAMIDEMMEQIRTATRHDGWTSEERSRAEADLARIMDRVRQEALAGPEGRTARHNAVG